MGVNTSEAKVKGGVYLGRGERTLQLRVRMLLQKTWVWSPAPRWGPTTTFNSISMASSTLFQTLWVPTLTYTCINNNNLRITVNHILNVYLNLDRCCQVNICSGCNCVLSSALGYAHEQPDPNSVCGKTGDRNRNYDNTYAASS